MSCPPIIYAHSVERIDDPVLIRIECVESQTPTVNIYCSAELLSIRSDFFRDVFCRNHSKQVTIQEQSTTNASDFLNEIHALNLDEINNIVWNKIFFDLAVKWKCRHFIPAYSRIIQVRFDAILRPAWIEINKTQYKERPLSIVGCRIENWFHAPFQRTGSRCSGVVTQAMSSCTFYISTMSKELDQQQIVKVNLSAAPDNCRILTYCPPQNDEDKKTFWEMTEAVIKYPELKLTFPYQHGKSIDIPLHTPTDLVGFLSLGPFWDLWSREDMLLLLSKEDLYQLATNIRGFGEARASLVTKDCHLRNTDDTDEGHHHKVASPRSPAHLKSPQPLHLSSTPGNVQLHSIGSFSEPTVGGEKQDNLDYDRHRRGGNSADDVHITLPSYPFCK